MSNPTKMAVEALRDAPGASALLARCETARSIAMLLAPLTRPLLPGLELAAARCDLRDGTLWITVDTGAESAKLRQAAPRLLAALTAHGYQVYELKTRIQAVASSYPGQGRAEASSPGVPFPPVTDLGLSAVDDAAEHLPDSGLRRALQRLARTLRGRQGKVLRQP